MKIIKRRGVMKRILLSIIFVLISIGPSHAVGKDLTFTWSAPETNVDGSPVTDLAGYEIQCGNVSRVYDVAFDVGNVLSYSHTFTDGDWYCAVRSVDTSGNWSDLSNECYSLIDSTRTKPPGGFKCNFKAD